MSKVPGANNATVADNKITRYLLKPRPKDDKSKLFMGFGFTMQDWTVLKAALLRHIVDNDGVFDRVTVNGKMFCVQCTLQTPDGRNPCFRSFWEIERGKTAPKFVTAFP